jgi:lipopolysaccharide biosynthesis regulator YciM
MVGTCLHVHVRVRLFHDAVSFVSHPGLHHLPRLRYRRHVSCFNCLSEWLKLHKRCPKCRKGMTIKALRRLFPN